MTHQAATSFHTDAHATINSETHAQGVRTNGIRNRLVME